MCFFTFYRISRPKRPGIKHMRDLSSKLFLLYARGRVGGLVSCVVYEKMSNCCCFSAYYLSFDSVNE